MSDLFSEKLVLASESPRRSKILCESGIAFEVVSPRVEERNYPIDSNNVYTGVQNLALEKAKSVTESRKGFYVLGADTIVVMDGVVLGKPESPTHAADMLRRLSGRSHEVVTGVAVVSPKSGVYTDSVSTNVLFRQLGADEVSKYVATGSPLDKAGGYGIQDRTLDAVESYGGCYLNVVGLPICAIEELLQKAAFPHFEPMVCKRHVPFLDQGVVR